MMAYERMHISGNYYDKTRHAVVQTYFCGVLPVMNGNGCSEGTMKKLEWAIGDGRVLSLFHEMQNAVEMV